MTQPQGRTEPLGPLECHVVDFGPEHPPSAVAVLCHGYGASGHDLVGVAGEWIHLLGESAKQFRFVCPIAPHSLADLGMPDGRAWWPINMAQLMEHVQANRFEELHRKTPPGIDEAREMLSATIREAVAGVTSEDPIPLAIGGFSQGAMLTMDTALRGEIPTPDILIQFSGTVVCQEDWSSAMPKLKETRVYQSHGTIDPVLPYSSATRLRDLIAAAEVKAQFHDFEGPHTIDIDSIAATATMLHQLVASE
ncbi:MAG: lysophospholipase [Planctomycetota bacterium]